MAAMRDWCWQIPGYNESKTEEVVIAMVLAEICVAYKCKFTAMTNPIANHSGSCVSKG